MQSGPGPRLACLSRHDALQPIHIHQPAPSLLPPPFMRLLGAGLCCVEPLQPFRHLIKSALNLISLPLFDSYTTTPLSLCLDLFATACSSLDSERASRSFSSLQLLPTEHSTYNKCSGSPLNPWIPISQAQQPAEDYVEQNRQRFPAFVESLRTLCLVLGLLVWLSRPIRYSRLAKVSKRRARAALRFALLVGCSSRDIQAREHAGCQ